VTSQVGNDLNVMITASLAKAHAVNQGCIDYDPPSVPTNPDL